MSLSNYFISQNNNTVRDLFSKFEREQARPFLNRSIESQLYHIKNILIVLIGLEVVDEDDLNEIKEQFHVAKKMC